MQAMHHQLATLSGPAVKHKLAKHCLGESKVQHDLRKYGSDLIATLNNADRTMGTTLNRIATQLTETMRSQTSVGVILGGVGLRPLNLMAVPTKLAAKLTTKPKLAELATSAYNGEAQPNRQQYKTYGQRRLINSP